MKVREYTALIEGTDELTVSTYSMKDAVSQVSRRCDEGEEFTIYRKDQPGRESWWRVNGPLAKNGATRI